MEGKTARVQTGGFVVPPREAGELGQADQAGELRQRLLAAGFSAETAELMVLEWWKEKLGARPDRPRR